jgi:hypothetical protein
MAVSGNASLLTGGAFPIVADASQETGVPRKGTHPKGDDSFDGKTLMINRLKLRAAFHSRS